MLQIKLNISIFFLTKKKTLRSFCRMPAIDELEETMVDTEEVVLFVQDKEADRTCMFIATDKFAFVICDHLKTKFSWLLIKAK